VRVIADEFESWEENPPSLPDFIKRDLRWCQGNLQYLKLLAMPGLNPMGRFQLINAIMMYVGAPMSLLMLAAGAGMAVSTHQARFTTSLAFGLYLSMLALGFAPRFLGVADILLSPGGARRYGGAGRLLAGSALDCLFSLMIGPVMMIAQAVFVAGLAFGRRVLWEAQNRSGRAVGAVEALRGLAPQALFGLLGATVLGLARPEALAWASPTLIPCLLAAPFAWITAGPGFSGWLVRLRLCAIPEEFEAVALQTFEDDAFEPAAFAGEPLLVED
jgi:membrane glycosyltransferase